MKAQTLLPMNRRGFLQKAGVGTLALGSLPILAETLATRAAADEEQTGFIFAAVSKGPTIDGIVHTVVMDGSGMITPSNVEGGGAFDHLNNAATAPFPKPFFAQGTWKAKRLVNFDVVGKYGLFTAGVLTIDIELVRELPSRLVVPPAWRLSATSHSRRSRRGNRRGSASALVTCSFIPPFRPWGLRSSLRQAVRSIDVRPPERPTDTTLLDQIVNRSDCRRFRSGV
jgi:hypothetical protein